MIKITYKSDSFGKKYEIFIKIIQLITITKAFYPDGRCMIIFNNFIKKIEHVKPTDL